MRIVAIFVAGLLLGAFFFGGILWTVGKSFSAKYPAVWFFGSWFVRIAVVLGAFYFVSAGRWERLVVCMSGFLITRFVMIFVSRMIVKHDGSNQKIDDEA